LRPFLVLGMARARRPRDSRRDARATAGGTPALRRKPKLQFEVNQQEYFLNYVEDEGRWYVFRPTGSGVIRIPVEIEAVHSEHFAFAPEEGKKRVVH
jgi:hypothetical protein